MEEAVLIETASWIIRKANTKNSPCIFDMHGLFVCLADTITRWKCRYWHQVQDEQSVPWRLSQ